MAGSYEEQTRARIFARGPSVRTLKAATATAKRERLPVLEEWAKKPRKMGETVRFLMALEETCKEQERTCQDLAEDGLRKTVHDQAQMIRAMQKKTAHDQAQMIRAMQKILKDVAAYIEHRAINGHKGWIQADSFSFDVYFAPRRHNT